MTNEEIVERIQAEDDAERMNDLYLVLWNSIKRFVTIKAEERAKPLGRNDYVADMLQEAFIILPEAVDYYKDDGRASFIYVYASFFMWKAFNIALYGGVTKKDHDDVLNSAISLELHLSNEDEGLTIGDTISDPAAEEELEDVDNKLFWKNVGSLLWEGISLLPEKQKELLTFIYKNKVTVREAIDFKVIGEGNKWHYYNTFNTGNKKLLKWLNTNRKKQATEIGIYDFVGKVQTSGYYGGGLGSFNSDHTSVVEKMAIQHIDKPFD